MKTNKYHRNKNSNNSFSLTLITLGSTSVRVLTNRNCAVFVRLTNKQNL